MSLTALDDTYSLHAGNFARILFFTIGRGDLNFERRMIGHPRSKLRGIHKE